MRGSKPIPFVLVILCVFPLIYWGSWHFWYKRMPSPSDPFAPASSLDKFFTPFRDFEQANLERKARRAAYLARQGTWAASVFYEGDVREIEVRIEDDILTFTKAKEWPALDGKKFPIIDEKSTFLTPYIITDIGEYGIDATPQENPEATRDSIRISSIGAFPFTEQLPSDTGLGVKFHRVE